MVLVLSTLSDSVLYLYKVSHRVSYGPEQQGRR